MLYYALVFLAVALIIVVLGFSGLATSTAGIAKLLFLGLMIAAVVGAVFHFFANRGRHSR